MAVTAEDYKRFREMEARSMRDRFETEDADKKREASGAWYDSFARGMGFDLNDEVGGAIYAASQLMNPSNERNFSESYTANRDLIRGRADAYQERNPLTAGALELGGGIGTGVVGAGRYLGGKVGMDAVKAGLGVGGLEGGLQGYGASTGGIQEDIMRGAGGAFYGGLAGAAIPLIQDRLGGIGNWIIDKLPTQKMKRSGPQKMMQETMDAGLETADDVRLQASRMGNNPTFAEASDAGIPVAQGLVDTSPGVLRIAKKGIADRIPGATGRVADVIERTTGRRPERIADVRRLATERSAAARPHYKHLETLQPAFDGTLQRLFERPSIQKAWKTAQKMAAEEDKVLPQIFDANGNITTIPDFTSWDYIKRALYKVEDKARNKMGSASAESRVIANTRHELVEHLDSISPDYRLAREAWGGPSQAMDLVQSGRRIIKDDTDDVLEELSRLSPEEKAHYMTGAWAAIRDRMGKGVEGEVKTYKFLDEINLKKKLRALYPAGEEGDQFAKELTQTIWNEKRLKEVNQKVIEGSQTQMRQAAGRRVRGAGVGLDELTASPARGIFRQMSAWLQSMPNKQTQELAERVFKPGGVEEALTWLEREGLTLTERTKWLQQLSASVRAGGPTTIPSIEFDPFE